MITIRSQKELLSHQDENGNYVFNESVIFECDAVFKGYAVFNRYAEFKGVAVFNRDAEFRGYAVFNRWYVDFKCDAVFRGDYLIILGDLYWSHASPLNQPGKCYIKRVLPAEWQRQYYQERLGMDISQGCYPYITRKVLKEILALLKDDKWTPTERWMFETLRNSEKPAPDWVNEIVSKKAVTND